MTAVDLKPLADIVGPMHAHGMNSAQGRALATRFGFVAGREVTYAGVFQPGTVEQLSAVVREIRRQGAGVLTTCNSAGNGATAEWIDAPLVSVDLSRMDRILDINAEYGTGLIEPGVSFSALRRHLADKQIKLWIDTDRESRNSICGSIFSKHSGCGPYGDHFGLQCGAEMVLRDGSVLRTGMGAMPDNPAWQLYKYALGPYVDGLFGQSNLGIPSKVGLWLMPVPPSFLPFAVRLPSQEAVAALIELMRPLRIANVVPNNVVIANAAWNRAPFDKPSAAGSTGEQGAWVAYGALYGLPENVALNRDLLRNLVGTIAGAQLSSGSEIKDEAGVERIGLMRGEARHEALNLNAWGGPACLRITFVASAEGEAARQMDDLARSRIASRAAPYLCEFSIASRALLQEIFLPYTPSNHRQRSGLAAVAEELIEEMGKAGFGVAGESFELRFIADRLTSGGPMGHLIDRIRQSFQSGPQQSTAAG